MFQSFQTCCKCFIWILHMLQWLYTYVARLCFTYFRHMLQQVLYVASIFISMHGMFHMFQMYVSYVSSECCMCSSGCCKSKSGPTYMLVHERAAQKRSKWRNNIRGGTGHAAWKRSEARSHRHRHVCIRAAPCGGG
jgi:hypothetical protein